MIEKPARSETTRLMPFSIDSSVISPIASGTLQVAASPLPFRTQPWRASVLDADASLTESLVRR